MKIRLKLTVLFIAFLFIPSAYSYCSPVRVYGNMSGGTNILESTINGFYTKLMPSISSGITITIKTNPRIKIGLDLSISYIFKSNYNDYFYYGPFAEIGISPLLEINLFKFLSIGITGGLAPIYTNYENSLNLKIGSYILVPFKNRWFKAIILQYEHGFTNGYSINERILLKTRILIYQKY